MNVEARRAAQTIDGKSGGLDLFIDGKFVATIIATDNQSLIISSPHFEGAGTEAGIGPYITINDGTKRNPQEPFIMLSFITGPYTYDETTGKLTKFHPQPDFPSSS